MREVEKPSLSSFVLLLLLGAIWGSTFIAFEVVLIDFSPIQIAFWRILIAALILFPIAVIKFSLPKDLRVWLMLLVISIINTIIPFFLIPWGQQYLNPGIVSILMATGPFVALFLAHILTHDEKFTPQKLIGTILGFIGILFIFSKIL